MAQVTT